MAESFVPKNVHELRIDPTASPAGVQDSGVWVPPHGMAVTDMLAAELPRKYHIIQSNPMTGAVGEAVATWWGRVNESLAARRGVFVIDTPSGQGLESLVVVFKRLLCARGLEWPGGSEPYPPLWVDAAEVDRDFKLRDRAVEAGLLMVAGVGMSHLSPDQSAAVLRTLSWQRHQAGKLTLWFALDLPGRAARIGRQVLELAQVSCEVIGRFPTEGEDEA